MWAKIRSWHRVKFTSRGGRLITFCGRVASAPELEAFPADEPTCETCLRIVSK